jgi:hypothetical protein
VNKPKVAFFAFLLSAAAQAKGPKPADFPLRIYVVSSKTHSVPMGSRIARTTTDCTIYGNSADCESAGATARTINAEVTVLEVRDDKMVYTLECSERPLSRRAAATWGVPSAKERQNRDGTLMGRRKGETADEALHGR